ncbi:MAG: amino acid-binding protein [Nitriliruptorales bacterium]
MRCWMRLSLPDRPGALGAIAAHLGRLHVDIRSLDVIGVDGAIAVDDLVVEFEGDDLHSLRRDLEQLDGVIVEVLRPLGGRRVGRSPIALATAMAEAQGSVTEVLVRGLPDALPASWCAVVRARDPQPIVVAASPGALSFANVETPWLPLSRPRRLESALWMPPAWRTGVHGLAVAAAPYGSPDEALVVARSFGPRFRDSELEQLGSLARLSMALREPAAVSG